MRFPNVLKM